MEVGSQSPGTLTDSMVASRMAGVSTPAIRLGAAACKPGWVKPSGRTPEEKRKEVPQQNVVVPKLEDNLRAKLNVGSRVQASGQ